MERVEANRNAAIEELETESGLWIGVSAVPNGRPSGPNTSLLWIASAALNVVVAPAIRTGGWGDLSTELIIFGPPWQLGYVWHNFLQPIEGARTLAGDVASRHTILLDEPASSAQGLLAATRILLTDIFHAAGAPEVRLVAPSGALRMEFLGHDRELARWAAANDVATE